MLEALDDIAGSVAITALVVATLALLIALAAWRRGGRPSADALEPITDDPALDRYLASQADRLEELWSVVGGMRDQGGALDGTIRTAIQHVGLVRFNPFDDTGGNQSFALALLDGNADGIVLSSLHSRSATRVYVKAVLAGRSEAPLSTEELGALRDAGLAI